MKFAQKIQEVFKNNLLSKAKSAILLVVLCIVLTASLLQNIAKIRHANERIEDARTKVNTLEQQNKDLSQNLDSMKSGEFVEKQLRDKLGLAKEGEIVLVLPDDDLLRRLVPKEAEDEQTLSQPNWDKWKKLFF